MLFSCNQTKPKLFDHPNGTSWYLLVAPKCQLVTMFGNQKNEAATWMGMFDSFLWEPNDDDR